MKELESTRWNEVQLVRAVKEIKWRLRKRITKRSRRRHPGRGETWELRTGLIQPHKEKRILCKASAQFSMRVFCLVLGIQWCKKTYGHYIGACEQVGHESNNDGNRTPCLIYCLQIYLSHSVGGPFILLIVSFSVKKTFSLLQSHLFIFAAVSLAWGEIYNKILLSLKSKSILCMSSRRFIVSCLTFKSLIGFELTLNMV